MIMVKGEFDKNGEDRHCLGQSTQTRHYHDNAIRIIVIMCDYVAIYIKLAITRLWRLVATAFRKKS